jgi:hypothetical protein
LSCLIVILVTVASSGIATGAKAAAQNRSDAPLRERHATLQVRLADSAFQKPLLIESRMAGGSVHSDVYAVIAHPLPILGRALQGSGFWCDIMMLHLNVKNCVPRSLVKDFESTKNIRVSLGRKHDQALAETYQIEFDYRVPVSLPDYFSVQLSAESGPMGTRQYRIAVEAIALSDHSSFIHMSYSYAYGASARLAMDVYLATLARNKVGFSIVDHRSDGSPIYVGGALGAVERNTMRYYLAIESFLAVFELPLNEQPEARIRNWFAATERYPRQLRELTRDEYLPMKRAELTRQRAAAGTP